MSSKIIDLNTYPRKEEFEYFRSLSLPYAGITAEVDVTDLYNFCKREGCSFTLAFLHAAALAADEVPEFRRRILDGQVIEYDECPTSHVEMRADESLCFCVLHHHMPWAEYINYAQVEQQKARSGGLFQESEESLSCYFVSIVPWLHYTAMLQPAACGDESNPRITWGKYETDHRNQLVLPLSILANHALVDGIHIARFYANLDKQMSMICGQKPVI